MEKELGLGRGTKTDTKPKERSEEQHTGGSTARAGTRNTKGKEARAVMMVDEKDNETRVALAAQSLLVTGTTLQVIGTSYWHISEGLKMGWWERFRWHDSYVGFVYCFK